MEKRKDSKKITKEDMKKTKDDMTKSAEELERKALRTIAELELSTRKKYALMLSWPNMVIIPLIGAFIVGCKIVSGSQNMKLMNNRAAYFDWGIAVVISLAVIALIARSVVLRKQFKADLEEYISSGRAEIDFEKSIDDMIKMKKAEDVLIRYPIETFEKLSLDEMTLADEEWEDFLFVATDRFFRMGSMKYTHAGEFYQIYVELRYQDLNDMDLREMRRAEELIEEKLEALQEHDPVTQAKEFKDDLRDLIRQVLAELFPYFRADEICIAVKKTSEVYPPFKRE